MSTRKDKVKSKEKDRRHGSRRSEQQRDRDNNNERTPRTTYVPTDDYSDDDGDHNSDAGNYEQDTVEQVANVVANMQINASDRRPAPSYTTENLQYGQQPSMANFSQPYVLGSPYPSNTYSSLMSQRAETPSSAYNANDVYPTGARTGTQSLFPTNAPIVQSPRSSNTFSNYEETYDPETSLPNLAIERGSSGLPRDSMVDRQGNHAEFGSDRESGVQSFSRVQPIRYTIAPSSQLRGVPDTVSPSHMPYGHQTGRYGLSPDSSQRPMGQTSATVPFGQQHHDYNLSTIPSQLLRAYNAVPPDQSQPLNPIHLPDPTSSCKCEDTGPGGESTLCGVIVWPKPKAPKDGKIKSKHKDSKTKSKKSSRRREATSKLDPVKVQV